ncbi:bactofilin family protein [Gluconobacter oxydans]|uniref:bactofilin family protein n=1 Tax=Gluconobacter oxydans TaxID=442 RepID=UPI00200EAAE0|nr:polymer-forming cytoskeletal protein [Gluconobacter oxydans]
MFRRRKPEDDSKPAENSKLAGQPIFPNRPDAPSQTAPASGSGSPTSPQQPNQQKDPAPMGRTPFPAPPSPNSSTGVMPAGAPRPGAAAVPGAPRQTGPERRTLVVGRGISVQGSVQDAERLVVEGTVESSMIQASELQVTHGGVFRGGVEVEDAELAGTIDGTLTVNGSLTIRSTGRLIGKVKCRRLQVEDGGQITGQLEMITDGAPARPAASEAAKAEPAAGEGSSEAP